MCGTFIYFKMDMRIFSRMITVIWCIVGTLYYIWHIISDPVLKVLCSSSSAMACEDVTSNSARDIIQGVDNFIFDCYGVLWDGQGAIDGSAETIALLKKLGKRIFYLTNNSNDTRNYYVQLCRKHGFDATKDEVLCTAYAAALYLHNRKFSGKVYVVGNPAMGEELDSFGIKHSGIGPDPVTNQRRLEDFATTQLDPEVNAVLVGFDPYLNFIKMLKGASYARREGTIFLATNEDTHLPMRDSELVIPGAGSVVAAVKYPARLQPTVIGKPQPTIFNVLRDAQNLDPSRTMMIGDTPKTDMGLAKNCGLKSLLVLSGITSEEDLNVLKTTKDEEFRKLAPDYYTKSLSEFGKLINSFI